MALRENITMERTNASAARRAETRSQTMQQVAEQTLGQKFASGIARIARPIIARPVASALALGEAAVDTIGGLLAGESREEIISNVQDAVTRGRDFGILGGSSVRPLSIGEGGVPKGAAGTATDVLSSTAAIASVAFPGLAAARGANLGKAMIAGALGEGTASAVGEVATQVQEGEIRPDEIASSFGYGAVFGAGVPVLGRAIGKIFPSIVSKEARAAEVASNAAKFNSEIAENATKNTLIYRLTDKSPDDLRKTLNRIVSKNDEVTQLSSRIADEEAALKALKETDMEANIRPALEEIRVARETTAIPMRERFLEVARQNNPTKARALVQGAVKNIDNALSKLKKSTSKYKKLSVAKNALLDGANYLLRDSKDLQRLGFQELPEFADDVIKILDSLPDSNAARLASQKMKQAAATSRKAFQALEDAKTKPQAFVKAAQDKLRATSQSKLAQQIAKKTEQLEKLKVAKKASLDEIMQLENTPEALYARELTGKFGSIDNFEKSFEVVKGLDGKKVASFIVPKDAAEFFKANIQPINRSANLFGFGADAVRAWESLAKNSDALQFIRHNIIEPTKRAAGNYSKKVTLQTKKITDLAKEAGLDYDRAPFLGMRRRYMKTKATQEIASKRAELREMLESGMDIEKMPTQVQGIARFIRDNFQSYYEMINKNRRMLGQPEIAFRKDYVTRSRAYSFLREIGYKENQITDDVIDKWVLRRAEDMKRERATMPYENMRKDSMDFEEDPIEAFLSYVHYAERDLEMNTLAARLRPYVKMVGDATNQKTEKYFNQWINEGVLGYVSGLDQRVDALSSTINISKALSKFGNMYSNATLAGNIGTILSQFTTIPLVAAKNGRVFNSIKALGLALSSNSAWLRSQSKTLQAMEAAFESSDQSMTRLLKQSENLGGSAVSDFLAKGMEWADMLAVKTAFIEDYTALIKAGIDPEKAIRLADDNASKLNGLYDRIFAPKLLRSKTVKALIPFQTFAFNLFNLITRDAVIIGTTESKIKAASYLAKMLGTMYFVNIMYDKAFGQEPFPITEDGNIQPFGAVPIVGGIPKYGMPGALKAAGVPFQFLGALLSRDAEVLREAKKDAPNFLRLFGIPGTAQAVRTLQGVQVLSEGGLKSGNTFVPVDTPTDILKTLIYGKWGSASAQEYLDKQKEASEKRFQKELEKTVE